MPAIEVDIELYCGRCGEGICANGTATAKRRKECFVIDPCERCLQKESDNAFEDGHEKGYEEARQAYGGAQ